MEMNILGVHIQMLLHLNVLSAPVWISELLISSFFVAGFLNYYQILYQRAFIVQGIQATQQYLFRAGLLVMSIGTALILHLIGYLMGDNALLFHNIGLFLLVFPLLNDRTNHFEFLIRILALLGILAMHQEMYYQRPQFIVAIILILAIVLGMRHFVIQIQKSIWACLLAFTAVGIIFWGLLPPFAATRQATVLILIQAVVMFVAMTLVAIQFWQHENAKAAKNARMQALANYDQLTNAKTYSSYQHDVTRMFQTAQDTKSTLTLVALDIDHFKQINDHYGHLAGNSILIGIAAKLSEILEHYQQAYHIYRTGGEEFNVVFPHQTPQDVMPIVTECWEAIRKYHFKYEAYEVPITISVGITEMRPEDHTIDDTYKRADDNLYLSKHAGRDTITVEGETLHNDNEHDLIATYTFFKQSIMQVQTGKTPQVYRNELLLRMYDHEHDRWILPEMFDISVRTQIDLIRKVLAVSSTRRVAINLTNAQFSDRKVAKALTLFYQSDEGPDELAVEITDVPDLKTTRNIGAIYRANGIRIDIDDVGSDNSYELVQHLLPYVDGVKFAMQNLRRESTAVQMQERIEFWVQIANKNELVFILEGVESADEVRFAQQLGIEFFQGYYYNKPGLPEI